MAQTEQQPIALINAQLLDPAKDNLEHGGLLIRDDLIEQISPELRRNAPKGSKVIDCGGKILAPGLVDMLVYTGVPGQEHRETLATASQAALAGGVTSMVCMPNTKPVIDDVALVDYIKRHATDPGNVHIYPMAAMTKGLAGVEMTEIGLLKKAGAIAFTNGKDSIPNAKTMRLVLSYAKDYDALIVHFTEDNELGDPGVMNEGLVSSRLGLPGRPFEAEVIMLERDIRLVELTGARYHAAQISCAASLDVIRKAKTRGLPISCGVSINHLTLNENDIGSYRTFFKMRPPLRTEDDRIALIGGVKDGTIDIVVSAHDPQDADVKRHPFEQASDGAIGLETLLPALLRLYHNGSLSLPEIFRVTSTNPASLLGLDAGQLKIGTPADLVLFDPMIPWLVDSLLLKSKSKNTPFENERMQGRILRTFVAGRELYR
ncbi:MAG: dihydroorotase [Hyphomicrobiaceae bacterium]|nr:dihydroorotase [Hyphomicrobiaceae bacterium]